MLLSRPDGALADAVCNVRVLLQIPALIDRHCERSPSLEIAIINKMLLGRCQLSVLDGPGDIAILLTLPLLIHLDAGYHQTDDPDEVII